MNRNSNLSALYRYSFCLAVFVFCAGCGRLRTFEQKIEKKLAEKPPGNLHSVTISWMPSTSVVVGYNVYRASPPGTSFEKRLTSQPIAATQYTDTIAVGGLSYSYYTTAVDPKGVESKPSNQATASIPYP